MINHGGFFYAFNPYQSNYKLNHILLFYTV